MSDHVHGADCTPDNCFREKMRYRREHGGLWVKYGDGTSPASPNLTSAELFHESTKAAEARKMAVTNEQAGNEIEKLSSRKELI